MDEQQRLDSAWTLIRLTRERVQAHENDSQDLRTALDRTTDAVLHSYARFRDSDDEMIAWWYRPLAVRSSRAEEQSPYRRPFKLSF